MFKDTARMERAVGLDVSDRESTYVVVDAAGEVAEAGKVATTAPALEKEFRRLGQGVVALEVGPHSPWISRLLQKLGHEVVVANPRQVQLIAKGKRKNDRADAEILARLARADRMLLAPVQHRGQEAQEQLALIHARAHLVEARTATINHVRATVKAVGGRLPSCSAAAFAEKVREELPEGLRAALGPLLETVAEQTVRIRAYDRAVERLAQERYPETGALRQVPGVGTLTALTYVLTLEDRGRFAKSRQVGAYLGLVPRQRESGESKPQLHITRAGDVYLRKLLVQCAHYIMGPFGPATALRRFGERLAGSGNGARKKRALVAVARKLAVLLHRLWVTGEVYEPWHGCKEETMAA